MSVHAATGSARSAPGFVDLHLHCTASDGVLEPEEVVQAAAAVQLSAMALTDHDTLDGIGRAQLEADRLGIQLVTGVELSAREGDRETHVLGLHLLRTGPLQARLVELREARVRRALRIVDRLHELGVPVTMDSVLLEAGGGAIGRPHIARALVVGGWTATVRAAFDEYLGGGRPAHIPKEPFPLAAVVEVIHAAGGVAILAHPAGEASLEHLSNMKRAGMDGVEVFHPSHSAEDSRRIAALCTELGLVPSGGSDWHGVDVGRRRIGGEQVPRRWLDEQLERAREIREQFGIV